MTQFTKKPVTIEATQWFKNGDHPLDYSKTHDGFENGEMRKFSPEEREDMGWEGDIVRYYRTPDVDGRTICKHCGGIMHDHGWIDTLEGGHIVCPGDWIITGVNGERYPCKPDIFEKTYLGYSPKTFLTPQDIEDEIISEHYFDAYDARQGSISSGNYQGRERPLPDEKDLAPLKQLTFCVLILKNGAKVVGINYGSIDPARHQADMGVIEARKDAVNKVWELMGYELKGKIHAANSV